MSYLFLGMLIAIGCLMNAPATQDFLTLTPKKNVTQIIPFKEETLDCGILHDRVSLFSPYICAPQDSLVEFMNQRNRREQLRLLYWAHCRYL